MKGNKGVNSESQKPTVHTRGVIVLIAFLALGVLLLFGTYFLSFTLRESEIAKIEEINDQAYYLAEAGIHEAVWKLKNDQNWEGNFTADCDWKSELVSRENTILPNSSYRFQVENNDCAKGEVTATSTLAINEEEIIEKAVRVRVSRELITLVENSAIFSGGESQNVTIAGSKVEINKGNIFCNNILDIKNGSEVSVFDDPDTEELEGQVLAVGNLIVTDSILDDVEAKCAKNICTESCEGYQFGISCCPPDLIKAPLVDFNSPDNPNSLRNRAQEKEIAGECEILCNGALCSTECLLAESQFDNLLSEIGWAGVLTLNNDITYVDGGVGLKGSRHLIVNGILAAEGTVDIWQGSPRLIIDEPLPTTPSGLLAKGKINFGKLAIFSNLTATGIVYSEEEIRLEGIFNEVSLRGGIWAKKVTFDNLSRGASITLDNERISRVLILSLSSGSSLPSAEYSPVITVEDWQEIY